MNWKTLLMSFVSIAVLALMSWLLKIDFQMLLLMSIAFDLTYMRNKEDKK